MSKINYSWQSYIRKLLLEAQKEICPICEKTLTLSQSIIEHSHSTGEIRSLTHKRCNNMVTKVETSTSKLNYIISRKLEERILAYLENHLKLVIEPMKGEFKPLNHFSSLRQVVSTKVSL